MKRTTEHWRNRALEAERALKKAIRETNPLTDWFRSHYPEIYRQGIAELLDNIGDVEQKPPNKSQKLPEKGHKLRVVSG